MFTLFTGCHVEGLKRSSNMAALHTRLCNFVRNISTNISALGRRTHLKLGENCLLYGWSTITQFFDFVRCIVFEFIFIAWQRTHSISLTCLEGGIYIITVLNPLLVHIILLNLLPVLVEDTPGNTLVHMLVHGKCSPARWASRKLRPKSNTISCFTSDCFKSSSLLFVDTLS